MNTHQLLKSRLNNKQINSNIISTVHDFPLQSTVVEAVHQLVTPPVIAGIPNIAAKESQTISSRITDIVLDNGSSASLIAVARFLAVSSGRVGFIPKEFVACFADAMQISVNKLDPQGVRSILLYMLVHRLANIDGDKINVSVDAGVFSRAATSFQEWMNSTNEIDATKARCKMRQSVVTPEALRTALIEYDGTLLPSLNIEQFTAKNYSEAQLALLVCPRKELAMTLQQVGNANPVSVQDPLLCHVSSAVLATAVNLGIFETLSLASHQDRDLSVIDLSYCEMLNPHISELPAGNTKLARNLNPKGVALLLDNLVATGILTQNDNHYRLQNCYEEYLTRGASDPSASASSKVGYIHLINGPGFIKPEMICHHLELSNREKSNQMMENIMDEAATQFLANGMHGLSKEHAKALRKSAALTNVFLELMNSLQHTQKLVSFGAGSGVVPTSIVADRLWIDQIEYCDIAPDVAKTSVSTIIDKREIREENSETLKRTKNECTQTLRFRWFDFFKNELQPQPSGTVIEAGNVLHDWSCENNVIILKNMLNALRAGGGILLTEKFLPNTPSLSHRNVANFNGAMQTWTMGQQYSLVDLNIWLKHAGQDHFELEVIPEGDDHLSTVMVKVPPSKLNIS